MRSILTSRRAGRAWFVALLFLCSAAAGAKKKKEDDTQTLALPKDPPFAAAADATRLVFHVSPLSGKGLLTQQTRDAIRAILKANGGGQIVHLRAFVAGSGDLRRVPQIVSEVFTKDKLPLPSVSVIQAGALPLEDAQIVLESVSESRKPVNPEGIGFVAAEDPARLRSPLAVTCYTSDLSTAASLQQRFPTAAVDVVQAERAPARTGTECEGVVRGGASGRVVFTGTQVAFGTTEKDAALAFQRLDRGLNEAGAAPDGILAMHLYPLSATLGRMAAGMRRTPGAMTIVPFEGVASMEASFAVDAVAAAKP